VVVDGAVTESTSFEDGLGGWEVAGPPDGTIGNANDWVRTQLAFDEGATVATKDTVYAGFGLEGLPPAERDVFVEKAHRVVGRRRQSSGFRMLGGLIEMRNPRTLMPASSATRPWEGPGSLAALPMPPPAAPGASGGGRRRPPRP
jgi:hypothetical protein